jgi:hypothetical protein
MRRTSTQPLPAGNPPAEADYCPSSWPANAVAENTIYLHLKVNGAAALGSYSPMQSGTLAPVGARAPESLHAATFQQRPTFHSWGAFSLCASARNNINTNTPKARYTPSPGASCANAKWAGNTKKFGKAAVKALQGSLTAYYGGKWKKYLTVKPLAGASTCSVSASEASAARASAGAASPWPSSPCPRLCNPFLARPWQTTAERHVWHATRRDAQTRVRSH